jgi:hypothetical protein
VVVRTPTHVGVAGLSIFAARLARQSWPAGRALMALHAWLPSIDDGPPLVELSDAMNSRPFPFTQVGHYARGVGLSRLAVEVTDRLRRIDHLLPACALPTDNPNWPMTLWLPVAAHWGQQSSSDSATELLERLVHAISNHNAVVLPRSGKSFGGGTGCDDPVAPGRLLVALVADLALTEAQALKWGRPSRLQRERVVACLRLLTDVVTACSGHSYPTAMIPVSSLLNGKIDDHATLATTATRLAVHVLRQVGDPCQSVIDLTMLPASPFHDEQLQIRVSQLRRVLYLCGSGTWFLSGLAERDIDALRTSLDQLHSMTWPASESAGWPSRPPLTKDAVLDTPIEAT